MNFRSFAAIWAKVKSYAKSNPDKIHQGLDKVEGVINDKTGGKYADKIAKASGAAEGALGVKDKPKT